MLIVEDNPDMNAFITQCLSRDYDVVSAIDGRDGLEKALALRPALIVSDIMMPRLSGDEMVAAIREQLGPEQTAILMLSAKADDALMVSLLQSGAQDFIVKPFSEADLRARVRNLILAHQARDHESSLREIAEAANRAKDEFLAMLGHELRNPLSPILTAVQLMKVQGPEHSDRARVIIERQVNNLVRLVDDLLDVSRIARGKLELKTQPIEIADVVARAIEISSPQIEQRRQVLTASVPRRGLPVDADPDRLGQVVSNLLTNAAKYTPAGGEIRVSGARDGDDVVLSVRDTGMGIDGEMLPRVFDLFAQETQAIDRAQGGLGIGLTIVRTLVEQHGGRVSAHSDGRGKGSEFVIRLPACAVRTPAASAGA